MNKNPEEVNLADDLLKEARSLKRATVESMVKEVSLLKSIIKFLAGALVILLIGVGVLVYRTFFITGPKVNDTNTIVKEVKNNNASLANLQIVVDKMNSFVEQVKRSSNPELQQELQKAIFDIRKFACTRDPQVCDQANIVPLPPPTTTSTDPKP